MFRNWFFDSLLVFFILHGMAPGYGRQFLMDCTRLQTGKQLARSSSVSCKICETYRGSRQKIWNPLVFKMRLHSLSFPFLPQRPSHTKSQSGKTGTTERKSALPSESACFPKPQRSVRKWATITTSWTFPKPGKPWTASRCRPLRRRKMYLLHLKVDSIM